MWKNKTKHKTATKWNNRQTQMSRHQTLRVLDIHRTKSIGWVALLGVGEVREPVSSHIGWPAKSWCPTHPTCTHLSSRVVTICKWNWWPQVSHSLTCAFVPPTYEAEYPLDFGFGHMIQFSQWNDNTCDATKGWQSAYMMGLAICTSLTIMRRPCMSSCPLVPERGWDTGRTEPLQLLHPSSRVSSGSIS